MSLCPEAEARSKMSDPEFWEWVFPDGEDGDEPDPPELSSPDEPCPACGTVGPCGYDANGMPMIHFLGDDR